MVSPRNQHCANCIGQIFVPYKATAKIIPLSCKKTTKRYWIHMRRVPENVQLHFFMNNLVQNWPILTIFDANYLRINSTWVFTTELIFLAAVASGAAGRTLHPVLYFVSVCYEQTDRDNHPRRTLSASNSTRSHIHWSIWIMMLKNDFFWIFRGEVATSDVRFCEIFVSVFLGI